MLGGILAGVTQRPFWSAKRIKEFAGEERVKEVVSDGIERRIESLYGSSTTRSIMPLSEYRALLFFLSKNQRTWLVADRSIACCVQDDPKWEKPKIELFAALGSMLPVEAKENGSEQYGVLFFGNRTRMWPYSKELFPNDPPKAAIERFLSPPVGVSSVPGSASSA
jgi:hypothetical protein